MDALTRSRVPDGGVFSPGRVGETGRDQRPIRAVLDEPAAVEAQLDA